MKSWTWSEVREKIQTDLGIQEDQMVTDEEMLGYVNEAVDECEANIHNLYEDYFLASETLALVSGTRDYSLPSDIYGQKIRYIEFNDGTCDYQIKRAPSLGKLAGITNDSNSAEDYFCYLVLNNLATGPTLRIYPTPAANYSTEVTIYYLRNAREITADTDVIDIPEFMNFIMQHIKVRVYEKDLGNPRIEKAIADLIRERAIMVETLSDRHADGVEPIDLDTSFYEGCV